jgi:hypothetical protein
MSTEPRQVPVSPSPDAARRRLHIHGIKEMPAGYDAEVAELFRDLRAASALSETDLAQKLATHVEVVQVLEQGALYALPPWPETCRIVNGYGALLNLDIRPLLRRIYAQLEAGIVELRPKAMPDVPTLDPPANVDFGFEANKPAPPPMPQVAWPSMPKPVPQAQNPWANATQAQPPQQSQRPAPAPPPPQQTSWPGPSQAAPKPVERQQPRPIQPPPPQPPRPQAQQPPQPVQQPPQPRAAAAPPPLTATPDPGTEKPTRKSPLLKWGLVALIVSVLVFGTWLVLGDLAGPSGPTASPPTDSSSPVLDPDDPRSRKADRLPNSF